MSENRRRTNRRGTNRELYGHLYSLAPHERSKTAYSYPLCVYCGSPADTVDHVPPLSRVAEYRALRPFREQYLLVKSCVPCNMALGDSVQPSLLERYELMKSLIRKKLPKNTPFWSEEDMARLGRNLRSLVGSQQDKKNRLQVRYEYVGGLRALLGYTGEEPVIHVHDEE